MRGLDHDDAERHAGDQPVAPGKVAGARRMPEWHLGNRRPAGVDQLRAIQPQRVAHAPSEPEVHRAGFLAEPLSERREKLVVRCRVRGQPVKVPLVVACDSRSAERLRKLSGVARQSARHFQPSISFRFDDDARMQPGARDA